MAELTRRLGTGDAVVIGLGSMIGAGVFAAFAPATRAAGAGLLIGLAVAAVVAYCNATSSARVAPATRRPAARTCTGTSGSGRSGVTSPGGGSWSGRLRAARRRH
ncbi:type IV secretory pathway TrbL component [Amycolatopsis thermophila]|uniref:Type IV secretory pathway TrbL component n=1 Tax=Amycolatopsis thermophila TaxID=206084 RepID=A0ABU0EXY9_9PSEU|nr:type IV secretory pathway TrbL component [Amycolatopsis thermophila]